MANYCHKNYGKSLLTRAGRSWNGGHYRVKAGRYRTVSQQSYIDESLFGDPNVGDVSDTERETNFHETRYTPSRCQPVTAACLTQDKTGGSMSCQPKLQEELKTISAGTVVRKLVVGWDPTFTEAIILPKETFCRIIEAAGHSRHGDVRGYRMADKAERHTQATVCAVCPWFNTDI